MKFKVLSSVALLAPLAACTFKPVVPVQPVDNTVAEDVFEQASITSADILIAIDNSGSMAEEQSNLAANMASFVTTVAGTGAKINFAVVTSDVRLNPEGLFVGVQIGNVGNNQNLPESVRDGAGNLLRALPDDSGARAVPFCQRVVQVIGPKGGVIATDDVEVLAILDEFNSIPDFTGRALGQFQDFDFDGIADNDVTPEFADIVGCVISVADDGFGFEAQLGQVAAALDTDSLANHHPLFLADPTSLLAVVVLSDEEDCTQSLTSNISEDRFVGGSSNLSNSLRCSLPQSQTVCGNAQLPGVFDTLVPVGEMANRLKDLRDGNKIFVATIAGPPGAVIVPDCATDPNLPEPSCFAEGSGNAVAGNRLFEFANLFENKITALDAPICGSFGDIVSQIGAELSALLDLLCLKADVPPGFDPATDLIIKIDISNSFDANGDPVLDCDGLGAGVATADPDNANLCLINSQFILFSSGVDACIEAGFAQGNSIEFDAAVSVPTGAKLFIQYVADN